jgi:hypothetical protein
VTIQGTYELIPDCTGIMTLNVSPLVRSVILAGLAADLLINAIE